MKSKHKGGKRLEGRHEKLRSNMGHGAKLVVTLDKWSKNDSNI